VQTNNLSLEKIIAICLNSENRHWENAWEEFLNRYKQLIFFFINRSCKSWHLNRLKIQLDDVVNDIFSEVIILVYRKLTTFENKDSEIKFISWLQVICNRSTTAHLQRKLKNLFHDDEYDEFVHFKVSHSEYQQWELYENIVSELRDTLKKNKTSEKYIHIFLLKIWSGFSTRQILTHPCYKELTENGINVIINRIRAKIK